MSYALEMDRRLSALRAAHTQAVREVSSSWDLFSGSSKDANLAALDQAGKRIGILASTNYTQVMAGTLAFSTWDGWAKETWRTISSVVSDVGSWSFSGVVSSTAQATASDTAELAKDAAKVGIPVLALVVVGLVALVVLRVT